MCFVGLFCYYLVLCQRYLLKVRTVICFVLLVDSYERRTSSSYNSPTTIEICSRQTNTQRTHNTQKSKNEKEKKTDPNDEKKSTICTQVRRPFLSSSDLTDSNSIYSAQYFGKIE